MQEMQHETLAIDDPKRNIREFFRAANQADLVVAMDKRKRELESQGYQLVRRKEVARNAPCPCGSGKKFKRCCIGAIIETR